MHILFIKLTEFLPKGVQNFRQCSHFTCERLLSEENRENCLKCWRQNTRPIMIAAVNRKARPKLRFAGNSNTNVDVEAESTIPPTISAAVLVPVCVSKKGEVSLLYTRRSGKLSRHVRQISFPGGIKDNTDASFEDCALRETEEEIGLKKERVHLWGSAGSVLQLPERPPIMPVIGVIKNFSLNELKLNKDEVEEAFTVSIEDLCSPSVMKHTQFRTGFSSPLFIIESKRIWGITALITKMFLECFLSKKVYKHKIEFLRPYKNA